MTDFNRVFITGRSAISASGSTADDTWNAVLSGHSGIDTIKQWDIAQWPCHIGGELKEAPNAKMLPDRKLIKVISSQDVLGIHAAVHAVEHSQLIAYRDTLSSTEHFNDQTAVYAGSPGNKYFQQNDFLPLIAKSKGNMQLFAQELFNDVHPMWLLRILPNNVLAYTGITYGFKGPNHNITNHAVSGMQALLEAYHAIRSGQVERAVVVSYDLGIEPQALFYYDRLGVLSAQHLKPFDNAHDGTVLADGAAALVLESEASVRARQATCYAEVLGGFSASEGQGLFSIEADGQQLADLLQRTIESSQLTTQDVGFIVAHGNGNAKSDDSESLAIKAVFSKEEQPVISAFKWSMGHTLCAAGLLDTVLATYALEQRCAPGVANLESLAPASNGLTIMSDHQPLRHEECAIVINRGFAGMNACVAVKACG